MFTCMNLSLWWAYVRFPGHSESMGFNALHSLKVKQNKTIDLFPFCIFLSNSSPHHPLGKHHSFQMEASLQKRRNQVTNILSFTREIKITHKERTLSDFLSSDL